MTRDIILFEHDSWDHFPDDESRIHLDELKKSDKDVLDQMRKKKYIDYSLTPNLELTSKNFVGSVKLQGIDARLSIVPKMFKGSSTAWWKETTVLLHFARNKNMKNFLRTHKNYFEKEDEEPYLLPFLHLDLTEETASLIRQGLLKSYVVHVENSSSMRGKLLMQQQMLNDMMLRPKFFCEFDELEYDTVENRVILQALTIVERTSSYTQAKMAAMDLAQRLSGVVQMADVRKPERQRMMQSYNRQNERYRHIHQTCEQVIEEVGIQSIYRGDTSHILPIFPDMDKHFEDFVANLFKKYYILPHGWIIKTQHQEDSWTGDKATLRTRKMKPDITFWEGDTCREIIDVKHKTKIISAGDLYQLGFYMHEYGKNNPSRAPIDRAFVIAPAYTDGIGGTYTAVKTGKEVRVERIDVSWCIKMIMANTDESKASLERYVTGLVPHPPMIG
jgi:5-methylcytosine-specific restriction endonuclease McrBC regulatory subunit McrC